MHARTYLLHVRAPNRPVPRRALLTMRRIATPLSQLLFVDWVGKLCIGRLGVKQSGSGTSPQGERYWTITLRDETDVEISFSGAKSVIHIACDNRHRGIIKEIEREAYRRTIANDYGEGSWWSLTFSTDLAMEMLTGIHFMRILSEHKRYQGYWKVGSDALLEFSHENVATAPLVVPKFTVTVTYRVPSPGHGPFGEFLAERMGMFLRALAAFVTAAPLQEGGLLFPASDDVSAMALQRITDEASDLFLEDVVLWPQLISLVNAPEDAEALRRVQGAIYSYEQAIEQKSEFVAIVLLVTAIEALTVPNAPWRKGRLTKRFVEFLMTACPDAVNGVMQHSNFRQAFGKTSSPTRFLENLYALRSNPLHTGMTPHSVTRIPGLGGESSIRIALISQLARSAILSFLRAPFSSLVGHPDIESQMNS